MAASVQIQKVNWWHERLADYMLAFPYATLQEIAREFDKSPSWISIVKNSDVFQDYWRKRSGMHSSTLTDEIKAKAFAATEVALEKINEKLNDPAASSLMTTETLLQVVDTTMRRFGYNNEHNNGPNITLNLGAVSPQQLESARQKLRALPDVVDLPALPVQKPEASDA